MFDQQGYLRLLPLDPHKHDILGYFQRVLSWVETNYASSRAVDVLAAAVSAGGR